jgi:putative ABC transport system substrate-binding protein
MAATTLHAPALQAQRAATTARVGVLSPFSRTTSAAWHEALERGLRERGWVPGANLVIDYRFAEGDTARLPDFARELVRLPVDLLVTEVTEATQAAQQVTKTLPIVMIAVGDPVGIGLISSLARPTGNITGLSQNIVESTGKRLELLKLVTPGLSEVAVLWNPDESNSVLNMKELQAASRGLGLQLRPSRHLPRRTACPRCFTCPSSRSWAACWPTAPTGWISSRGPPPTSTGS